MKNKTYFENLNDAVIQNNKKALAYRDGHAWDNKKKKNKEITHAKRSCVYSADRNGMEKLSR